MALRRPHKGMKMAVPLPPSIPALEPESRAGDVDSRLREKTTRGRCKLFRTE